MVRKYSIHPARLPGKLSALTVELTDRAPEAGESGFMRGLQRCIHFSQVLTALAIDLMRFLHTSVRSRMALAAENLFLRKQLALYRER